ncbi:MAG TPA: VOC family protein [Propionibacteriaceae bacterium]
MQGPQWLHVFIDVRADVSQASAKFWSAALGWQLGDPWPGHPEFRSFEPEDGDTYVHQQMGDHGPRIHFDLEVTDETEVERLINLGASLAGEPREWWPMISPGGMPFCLVRRRDHVRPSPLTWDGHHSRLVQVCIDSPAGLHEAEVAFWRSALSCERRKSRAAARRRREPRRLFSASDDDGGGFQARCASSSETLSWRWADSESDEFAGKLYPPPGSSVQLLFQRLGKNAPDGPVRAHIDLGTDDREAHAQRLVQLGATRVGPGRGWIVLRDPTGLVFCTTSNSPDAP